MFLEIRKSLIFRRVTENRAQKVKFYSKKVRKYFFIQKLFISLHYQNNNNGEQIATKLKIMTTADLLNTYKIQLESEREYLAKELKNLAADLQRDPWAIASHPICANKVNASAQRVKELEVLVDRLSKVSQ